MQPFKILYVEDYDLVLLTVKQMLEYEGWDVEICRDGTYALQKIESNEHYDLMILDCELPGERGVDLVRRARELMHHQHTPIVMFTASGSESEALVAGADAFLNKPIGIRDLVATAKRLLTNQESAFRLVG